MTIILLWLLVLAGGLLIATFVAALAARTQRLSVGGFGVAIAVLWLLCHGAPVFLTGMLFIPRGWAPRAFIFSSTLAFLHLVVGIAILRSGLRARGDQPRAARAWPAGRLAVATILVVGLAIVVGRHLDVSARAKLQETADQARQTARDLSPAKAPDENNAANPLNQIGTIERGQPALPQFLLEARLPPATAPSLPALYAASVYNDPRVHDYLATQEAMLALARRAAAMPHCSHDCDYAAFNALDDVTARQGRMRHIVHVMALRAMVALEQDRPGPATADLRDMQRLVRHQLREPLLISALVTIWLDALRATVVAEAINTGKLGADDLAQLAEESQIEFQPAVQRAMRVEESMFTILLCGLAGGGDAPTLTATGTNPMSDFGSAWASTAGSGPPGWFFRVLIIDDELESYHRVMNEVQRALGDTPAAALAWAKAPTHEDNIKHAGMLTRILAPAAGRAIRAAVTGDAQHRLTRTGIAVARYRAKHGRLPDRIDALVPEFLPEVPIDPFDGKPLRLIVSDQHVKVYSIGIDQKDDLGDPGEYLRGTSSMAHRGDVTFQFRCQVGGPE